MLSLNLFPFPLFQREGVPLVLGDSPDTGAGGSVKTLSSVKWRLHLLADKDETYNSHGCELAPSEGLVGSQRLCIKVESGLQGISHSTMQRLFKAVPDSSYRLGQ
jgi:hypothetical protein